MDKKKSVALYPVWNRIEELLEEKIGLNQLAFFSNYSPWHFHRIFSNFHGETLGDYIKRLRLEKSAYALKITNYPIMEIAIECGYSSNEAYTKSFKKQFGKTPLQYRKIYSQRKCIDRNLNFPIHSLSSYKRKSIRPKAN
ncbi:MAG: AraC family transcriptional regulator [Leptospiraceae bacterium]|nr:AraC family transcriptional regulator [Leptospiraceae bacterium]